MYDVKTNKNNLISPIMSREGKHQGAWGDDSGSGPGLFGFMAPRMVGMVIVGLAVFAFISGIQLLVGQNPVLLQQLYTQIFH